jgi:uncharacterized protein (DUF924 family)
LNFWFGAPGSSDFGAKREAWFKKNPAFDAAITAKFGADYQRARAGAYDHWQKTAHGALALLLLLDQFPRNMFRDDPRSFDTDRKALDVALHAVAQGLDKEVTPTERMFFYLPFEHSEDLAMQERSKELTRALPDWEQPGSPYAYAVQHWDIIRRFGRFPHRNAILLRVTSPAEQEFLKAPGSGF